MVAKKEPRKLQTTVRLPRPLYEQARWFVEKGVSSAENMNDFVIAALTAYVKMLRRKSIDAAFCGMAVDTNYQKEAQLIAEEFEASDWEALEIAEKESVEADATR